MNPMTMVTFQVEALNDWIAGKLAGSHISLYSNNITIHDNLRISELDLVTEPGMIAAALTWNPAYLDGSNRATLAAISQLFASTGIPAASFIVYGWAIHNAGATELYAAVNIAQPFTVDRAGQGITVDPLLQPFPANL